MTLGALLGHGFTAERVRKPAAFCRPMALVCSLVLAILGVVPVAAAPAQAAGPDTQSTQMLVLVNAVRAEAGQPALTMEPRLSAAACGHARDLARGGPLSHRGSDGSDLADRLVRAGYPFTLAAENLAAGVTTPDETVWLWSGSPGHRQNMLTAEFRAAGIAHLTGAGGEIWVLVLGTARPEQAPPPGAAGRRADVKDDMAITCY